MALDSSLYEPLKSWNIGSGKQKGKVVLIVYTLFSDITWETNFCMKFYVSLWWWIRCWGYLYQPSRTCAGFWNQYNIVAKQWNYNLWVWIGRKKAFFPHTIIGNSISHTALAKWLVSLSEFDTFSLITFGKSKDPLNWIVLLTW